MSRLLSAPALSPTLSVDFARVDLGVGGTLAPRCRRVRLVGVCSILMLWLGALGLRLYSLQISDFERWQDWALRQHFTQIELASERGAVLDRNGKMLATSVPAGSVYVRPRMIEDKAAFSKKLAKVLELDPKAVQQKISEAKPFVWISRQMPRAVAARVSELANPAVGYVLEAKRIYPYNQVASSLIGKVGTDGLGLSGVERVYDKTLRGQNTASRASRDALGKPIHVVSATEDDFELPHGEQLRMTIDADVAAIMDEELEASRVESNAKATVGVMVDADTGDILAMGQSPSANFNLSQVKSKDEFKNFAVELTFEPGSIMKPIIAAAALDSGVVRGDDIIDCESGRYEYAGHTIKDVHPSASIPFFDVVVRSSNIGMTKVGLRMGGARVYSALRAFGFGEAPQLALPGESRGILRPLGSWAKIDVATHSFGQGVSVTPLQMVRAMSAIANGGLLPKLRILDDGQEREVTRVLSASTASKVREMLYGVVEDEHGTGQKALIQGLRVGGKTGTAQKARADGKGYAAGEYVASFLGFASGETIGLKKNIAMIVIVDEAHSKSIYGGTLAAPVFKRILQRSMSLLATKQQLKTPEFSSRPVLQKAQDKGHDSVVPVVKDPVVAYVADVGQEG